MINITEESGVHKEWLPEAKKQTLETLPVFLNKLMGDYEHDYGTIVHAIAAGMQATFSAMNNHSQGGITGFQAGCLMWEVLQNSFHIEAPARLLDYKDMLYPQHESRFTQISQETWKQVQEMASENLKNTEHAAPSVVAHWESIASGVVPFGLKLEAEQ